jgi:CHAT domain-containing protein
MDAAAAFARSAGERVIAAGADVNIATIYAQLGNFALARSKLERAIQELRDSGRPDLLANAYLSLSYQQIRLGDVNSGLASSDLAIRTAHDAKLGAIEANAWDFRGAALLRIPQMGSAEACFQKAVELYASLGQSVPALTNSHLAELEWRRHQLAAAKAHIDLAFAKPDTAFQHSPHFYPLYIRAVILRDMDRTEDALAGYRACIQSASAWRRSALPGDSTNIETVRQLNDVYQGFADYAAEQSLTRHNEALAREAFEALAENRASGLREEIALRLNQTGALPPEYLEKLGELQSVQGRVTLADDVVAQKRLADLESDIAELETKIGLQAQKVTFSTEKNLARNSLRDIQAGLSRSDVLLSFCLGEQRSFVWAITSDTMRLYRLPPAGVITQHAAEVREALEHNRRFDALAHQLSADLFSQLTPEVRSKTNWLVVGDGSLWDRVPFSALPVSGNDLLIQEHSVRLLPSALMLRDRPAEVECKRFLGIADPLYNLADSRRSQPMLLRNASRPAGSSRLGRLPGSQREIRISAQHSGMPESTLLVGGDATIASLTAALSQHPSIIHFAVHVVSPPGHPEQAALALSLGERGIPELLTREKIGSLHVPGSLVVLSGCSSGQGQTVPSTGLVGLGRAWLLAGASAVVVSNWPTPDDSGAFFSLFYSYLKSSSGTAGESSSIAKRAAEALRRTQLEVQRQGGYGSAPAFWSAYSVVAKE